MAKASIEKPNGTVISIEGSAEEVEHFLSFYDKYEEKKIHYKDLVTEEDSNQSSEQDKELKLSNVVNTIKACEEAEAIESNILNRSSEVNRVLLPLYIVYEYMDNRYSLITVDIEKITTDLGVKIRRQNAYRSLTNSGSSYVSTDSVRRHGVATNYKLNKRGKKYLKSVIHRETNDE
jgi:hypothetical protein